MTDKVLHAELTPAEFEERLAATPVAYLPLGTLEWHGRHMPLGSDAIQSYEFFQCLAREAGGIVLPPLFLGPDRMIETEDGDLYGMDIGELEKRDPDKRYTNQQLPGSCYWVSDELFGEMIEAILKQLKRCGFRVVVAHGHGPSTGFFLENAEAWKKKFGLTCLHCWDHNNESNGIQTGHGATNETSLVMAFKPELVKMENLPSDINTWPLGIAGIDPRVHASAEFGKQCVQRGVERMKKLIAEALAQEE